MALHLWLVMTRQPAADGSNGTITMQGYGFFQSIDAIMVYPGGEVPRNPCVACSAGACLAFGAMLAHQDSAAPWSLLSYMSCRS